MSDPSRAQPESLPHDIYELSEYPFSLDAWVWFVIATICVGLLIAGIVYWLRRKRKRVEKQRPLSSILQEKLEALVPPTPFEGVVQEEYFFRLSLALREVIEQVTPLRATDQTLHELRKPLREQMFKFGGHGDDIIQFLQVADYIKFASREASFQEAAEYHKSVLLWVAPMVSRMRVQEEEMILKEESK